jgi:RNA polymerase sigma factor (sigma-70 family)
LAQEALAKAWAARASYLPNTNFKAWIFTILRNHYYSWCRKQRRVASWDPDAAEKLLVCEPAQQGHMALAELAAGLQSLPAQQREALILVGAGGFAYEEAAQIIQTAPNVASACFCILAEMASEPILKGLATRSHHRRFGACLSPQLCASFRKARP